jgi:hypothetical protein
MFEWLWPRMFYEHRRTLLGTWLILLLFGLAGLEPLLADSEATAGLREGSPKLLTASIYSHDGGPQRLLYRFKRVAERFGPTLTVLREFAYADGKLAARERVVYSGNSLKSYELEELQTGGAGSARVEPDPKNPAKKALALQYADSPASRGRSETRREPLTENTLVNDMAGPFLAAHWEQLRSGQSVRCQCVVVPRRETIGFTFKRIPSPPGVARMS